MNAQAPDRPAFVYKYQPVSLPTLSNLQSQIIYFCAPSNFNDPYDCAIAARIARLTDEEIQELRKLFLADANPAMEDELRRLEDNRLRGFVEQRTEQVVEALRRERRNTIGIACFTEKKDNLLMWSHYANRGRGICLEFDTTFDPFTLMRRVNYVEHYPALNALRLLNRADRESHVDLFCTKSSDWSYEHEWRSIHSEAGTEWRYDADALKAIYFGPEIDRTHLGVVCQVVQGQFPEVRFFQGHRSGTEFKVEFAEFTYVPTIGRIGLLNMAHRADP